MSLQSTYQQNKNRNNKLVSVVTKSWSFSNLYIYIYIEVKLRENPIRIQLESNFAPCVPSNLSFFNFCAK